MERGTQRKANSRRAPELSSLRFGQQRSTPNFRTGILRHLRQLGTYTTNDPTPPTMGRLTHAEGIQINESGDSRPEYIGATKQNNNTAELTALYRPSQQATQRCAPRDNIHGFAVRTKRHLRRMERRKKDPQEDDPKPSKGMESSTEATRDANRKHRTHPFTHRMARERASRSGRDSGHGKDQRGGRDTQRTSQDQDQSAIAHEAT